MDQLSTLNVVLNPRPYENVSGKLLLVPLLPDSPPKITLPREIWERVLAHAVRGAYEVGHLKDPLPRSQWCAELGTVCKTFSLIMPPLLFAHPVINSVPMLQALAAKAMDGDARWDNLHRIEYSTPGRWICSLDMANMSVADDERLLFDSLLRLLIPLLPFLSSIHLNSRIRLSRGAYASLPRSRLRVFTGAVFDAPHLGPTAPAGAVDSVRTMYRSLQDPLVTFLRSCTALEELELVPPTKDDDESDEEDIFPIPDGAEQENHDPLEMPQLRRLALLLKPDSPLVRLLARSCLPNLHHLVLHAEVATSTTFLETHGTSLSALALFVPPKTVVPGYPTHPLTSCPSLRHLILPSSDISLHLEGRQTHPLVTLSVPKPAAHLLTTLESGCFPALRVVQLREARWLRRGVASQARITGVAGEMGRWRARLSRLGVKVLDADGRQEGA
ncbi:hypothetical protein BKA62DRAFT_691724 [Auriculariales sp. MPI-PUGE-AT-0066]|nr:hypothetical protein BKA62DRAFT_691724 [Auriculariales sp. MPI-PUGE-AT-0066]